MPGIFRALDGTAEAVPYKALERRKKERKKWVLWFGAEHVPRLGKKDSRYSKEAALVYKFRGIRS
jgi:hypothetical protein